MEGATHPAKLGTAYRNWPRHTGGATSRAQHLCAALSFNMDAHSYGGNEYGKAPLLLAY